MKQHFAATLAPEATVTTTFLVQFKEQRLTANGRAYLALELQDATGSLRARLWEIEGRQLDFAVDDVVEVTGTIEEHQGVRQLRLTDINRLPEQEIDLLDYLPRSRFNPEILYASLVERVLQISEGPLRSLLLAILEDASIAAKYKLCPAATAYHHARLGGLIEHVTSLVALSERVCDHYSWLDRELVLAGIILHDIGKIEELSYERSFYYSTRGQLLGHISLGLEIVQQKIRCIPDFPAGLKTRLEHMILAHHGRLEWGSPKEPRFPEALVVHYLDDLDSKLESMQAQYALDENQPGEWTSRSRSLGRELLKR